MTRGVRKGVVTCAELIKRLGIGDKDPKGKPYTKKELIILAIHANKLTEEEINLSIPNRNSVIKCYLNSLFGSSDSDTRYKLVIDTYVKAASQLYTRGSIIANLIVNDVLGDIQNCKKIQKYDFASANNDVKKLFELISSDTLKQCFLPERYPSSKIQRDPLIDNVLQAHQENLQTLLPNWKAIMSTSGWDNVINRMGSKYLANVKNHVSVHLKDYIMKYFEVIPLEDQTPRNEYYNLFNRPLRPLTICNDDYFFITNLRLFLGISDVSDYVGNTFEFNDQTFNLMMFLVKQGITGGCYLPVSTLGRKYCYIDAKVTRFLLPELFKQKSNELRREPNLMEMFEITPDKYRQRRKALRKMLRSRYRGNNKKLQKKWFHIGCSNMPRDAFIASFETDGVGVSLCIQRPIQIFDNNTNAEDFLHDPVFVGVDGGRAKLFTASISKCGYKKPETFYYTRKEYYYDIKHKIRKRFEAERMANQEVRTAIENLATDGGKRNISSYLGKISTHYTTLYNEFIEYKGRAIWSMRLYRLKKRALDKVVQKVINSTDRDMVIGIGDAKIAPTGKGEQSMPTCQLLKTFLKAKRKTTNRKIRLLGINEFRTTLCCCACGEVTSSCVLKNGTRSKRLRLCSNCTVEDSKVRDRDVQAARNILWLTQYEYNGCERPSYMCRPSRTLMTS